MAGVAKKVKRNMSWIQWIVPTFLFAVFMTISLVSFNRSDTGNARTEVVSGLAEQVSLYTSQYEQDFDDYKRVTQTAADYCLMDPDNLFSEENQKLLRKIEKNYPFLKGYIIKPDYTAVDSEGSTYKDISLTGVFSQLSFVNADITDFYLYKTDQATAYVSAPIKSDDKVLGLVAFECQAKSMKEVVDTPNYISTNVYALVSKEGIIVDRAGLEGAFMEKGSNLYEKFDTYQFLLSSKDQMKSAVEKGNSGYVVAQMNASNVRYFFYRPLNEGETFFVMSVNSGMINHKIDSISEASKNMMVRSLVVMGIFIIVLLIIVIMNLTKNSRANKELINKSQTDLLTDLLNKKTTEEKIKEYLEEEGVGKKCMMFILDIDNFKNINDTMGHAFGDEVIATLGKQLRSEFRVNDIVGRTGGDEFTIFLKDLKDDNLLRSEADRVLGIFKNFKVGEYTKYFATASIGVSIYPQDADSFEGLYKAADQALYKAKNRGKNQMAFYKEDNA